MTDFKAEKRVELRLVRGAPPQKLTGRMFLHFLYLVFPQIFVIIPLRVLWHHVLNRRWSPLVQILGRKALADAVTKIAQFILSRAHVEQSRIVFNRDRSYRLIHAISPYFRGQWRSWVERIEVNGTAGRWIAKPGTERKKDEAVLYFIHGGGFVLDTGSNAQELLLNVAKQLNLKRRAQCSIFCLDYRLAPEFKYPSQVIEALAGYHYLVNTLGISESKICLAGDSAGGNIAAALLLHLARPAPEILVPVELGKTPGRPGAAFLISPYVNLVSRARSNWTNARYDFIDAGSGFRACLDYIGVPPPPRHESPMPSWNPIYWLVFPNKLAPQGLLEGDLRADESEWSGYRGVELLKNPYVNPSVVQDEAWWKEACPPDGKTVVCWGGKEIFADDDEALYHVLQKSGVAPTKLFKEFGAHDWILHDWSVPTSWRSRAKGPDKDGFYGLNALCGILQRLAEEGRKSISDSDGASIVHNDSVEPTMTPSASTTRAPRSKGKAPAEGSVSGASYAEAAASTASLADNSAIVNEGEGDVNRLVDSMGESGVMVERAEGRE
ncbi:hypothetical protein JCM1840_006536 [Sporobolomyces johnsonii]